MRISHILMAVAISFIWGTNFVAIKLSYSAFTPFALLFVRFIFSIFPWIFFIPKPQVSWRYLIMVSSFLWIGQFSCLFLGIYWGASPGIASLILQSQSIFTLILSVIFLHYRPHKGEIIGLTVAFIGITMIAVQQFHGGTFIGLAMIVPAAISVSFASILFSQTSKASDHPLSMVVWTSLIPPIPMLLLSFYFEGFEALPHALTCLNFQVIACIAYTVYFSTLLATSMWTTLLRYYSAATIVPYSLLIPIFGMASSALILGENYTWIDLGAGTLVLLGLSINQMTKRRNIVSV